MSIKLQTTTHLINDLKKLKNKQQALLLSSYFKTGPGDYAEGDIFWGIKVPILRNLADKYKLLNLSDLSLFLNSSIHEQRFIALLILIKQYKLQEQIIFKFYFKNAKQVNNWDLVDLSADKIFGHFLFHFCSKKERLDYLKDFAGSENLWLRRIAMVSTFYFIKNKQSEEAIFLINLLLKNKEKHDLIHKAMGWMLREIGKRVDRDILLTFLNKKANLLPRVTLRYAIEHLSQEERLYYLNIGK